MWAINSLWFNDLEYGNIIEHMIAELVDYSYMRIIFRCTCESLLRLWRVPFT